MSDFDYVKHLGYPDSCSVTYKETNPVYCRTAHISASGKKCLVFVWPTFQGGLFVCDSRADIYAGHDGVVEIDEIQAPTVKLTCTHAARLEIRRLIGVTSLEINCDYASTVKIHESLQATSVTFNVSYSSTLIMGGVQIDKLNGRLNYSSYGRSRGTIKFPNVDVLNASRWDSQPSKASRETSAALWEQAIAAAAGAQAL